LAAAALTGQHTVFRWLLFACLISDIMDGRIARAFDLCSDLGATLDSIADILVVADSILGMWVFNREVLTSHWAVVLTVAVLYFGQIAIALWRYGRVSSFHTVLTGVAAYAVGTFCITLFFWGYVVALFYAALALAAAASTEELILLCLCPGWIPDVGGLYWVLGKHRNDRVNRVLGGLGESRGRAEQSRGTKTVRSVHWSLRR
jgi:cardiolipin synthase